MEKQLLHKGWKLQWKDRFLETSVPFSVYYDLLNAGEIEHPYYRDNEDKVFPLSQEDYVYQKTFDMPEKMKGCSRIWLRFEGVDTLADIFLNGQLLGKTFNMHREWEFPVESILQEKENLLEVKFHSPVRYMEEQVKKQGAIPCNTDTIDGFPYLRKAHCMSGWDWAPKLPDMGIFRDVSLVGMELERIYHVHIRQQHQDGAVKLTVTADTFRSRCGKHADLLVEVIGPDGCRVQA